MFLSKSRILIPEGDMLGSNSTYKRSCTARQTIKSAIFTFLSAALSASFYPLTDHIGSLLTADDEANCMRPLHLPLLTAAALCSPHFTLSLSGFLSFTNDESAKLICLTSSRIQHTRISLLHSPPLSFTSSRFMPALYLSVICSSFAVCITTIKFIAPAWRLYHETRNPKIIGNSNSNDEYLRLDIGFSAVFVIFSLLLLVFSFVGPEEKGLQILLSFVGGSFLVYQVGCLIHFRKALLTFSERGYVWVYCGNWLYGLRWAPLIFVIVTTAISILIALSVDYTKALKITLLSIFLAGYIEIFIEYLVKLLFGGKHYPLITSLILWNMVFGCLAWVGALASLVFYLKGNVDFITSLWVSKIKFNH